MAKKTKRRQSSLTDEESAEIASLMRKPGSRRRSREVEFREGADAVRYLGRSGCARGYRGSVSAGDIRSAAAFGNWRGDSYSGSLNDKAEFHAVEIERNAWTQDKAFKPKPSASIGRRSAWRGR